MPRDARVTSSSGIYHVIIRGANKQEIFHDDQDCIRFLRIILKYKKVTGIKVYAWCLMGNHVHLLLKVGHVSISSVMKRIGVSYVWYYNNKYDTVGSLFQDRFKSENVESVRYFLTVTRYIHQNPLKAGIVTRPEEWKWSSCRIYYGGKAGYLQGLLDDYFVLSKFGKEMKSAREQFKTFNEDVNDDRCLDNQYRKRLTDREARVHIQNVLESIEIPQVKSLAREERNALLRKVKEIEGVSQRQAARILGVPPSLVYRA